MAEDQELAAVEDLLRMDAVWAEPPDGLEQRIHAELFGGDLVEPPIQLRTVCLAAQHFERTDE